MTCSAPLRSNGKSLNRSKPYRDQVKPFGFLLSFQALAPALLESVLPDNDLPEPLRPIAAFDTDISRAADNAIDREKGKSVPREALQTYAQALAQYHLHSEAKFENGEYLDRGLTRRRHVLVEDVDYIGKEAHLLEQQTQTGFDSDAPIVYGKGLRS